MITYTLFQYFVPWSPTGLLDFLVDIIDVQCVVWRGLHGWLTHTNQMFSTFFICLSSPLRNLKKKFFDANLSGMWSGYLSCNKDHTTATELDLEVRTKHHQLTLLLPPHWQGENKRTTFSHLTSLQIFFRSIFLVVENWKKSMTAHFQRHGSI